MPSLAREDKPELELLVVRDAAQEADALNWAKEILYCGGSSTFVAAVNVMVACFGTLDSVKQAKPVTVYGEAIYRISFL